MNLKDWIYLKCYTLSQTLNHVKGTKTKTHHQQTKGLQPHNRQRNDRRISMNILIATYSIINEVSRKLHRLIVCS